ncbi:MAG: flagellin FliC [Deltaproteobacteria bacterium]|nr:flagellin FliC [Deltaproteobacteria bacterium]
MALRITNNIQSLNAQRNISRSQQGLTKALERLSSGYRINRAGDDAAGLAISEKLRSNIRALSQASRNGSDGIGLIQVAEGAMSEISSIIVRMKELAEQAATGTVGTTERGFLDSEFQALRAEITRISDSIKFNERQLLDGTLDVVIQIGVSNGAGDTIQITLSDTDATALGIVSSIATVTNARLALTTTSSAINTVASRRAGLGAMQNRLESVVANIDNVVENLSAAESRIRDVDIAAETAELTKYNILVQAGVSVLSQANQAPTVALALLQ